MINRKVKYDVMRFLSGNCTPEEDVRISGLIATNKQYSSYYRQLSGLWSRFETKTGQTGFDAEAAFILVKEKINKLPQQQVHKPVMRALPFTRWSYYVAGAAALFIIGLVLLNTITFQKPFDTLATGNAAIAPLSLSDGSQLFLNSHSSVKFPEKFGSTSREVYFWGEAFFEIVPDAARPFTIDMGEAKVKVLGTSFNIKAYQADDNVEVTVNSGKVLFYRADESGRILDQVSLVKSEKGIFSKSSGKFWKSINLDLNYLSWKTGILTFNETSLDKVLGDVSRKYGVRFKYDGTDVSSLKLTATFDNETLDSVLEIIQLVHHLKFIPNGKDYLVQKAG